MRTLLVECAFGLALAASICPVTSVSAQEAEVVAPGPSETEMHLAAGHAAYDAGNFTAASDSFEAAYRVSHDPEVLRFVFESHRAAGELEIATIALRSYVTEVPGSPDHAELLVRLDTLDAQIAAAAAAPDDTAVVDEAPIAVEPLPMTRVEPVAPARDETGRIASYAVTGAGIGLVLAATFIGFSALGTQTSLDDQCGPLRDMCPAGFSSDRDRGQTLAIVTDIVGITGALTLGTGIALLFLFQEDDAPPVQAGCGPDGCMIQATGSF